MADNDKPIKMQLPNKKTSSKMMAAKGLVMKNGDAATNNYATSSVVSVPITKAAQFAGAGANVIMTQPMFFSPLHTPQNWQIASKRKEVYQWLYTTHNDVVKSDFTFIPLADLTYTTQEIIEDTLTGGILHENIESEQILGATGQFRKPCRYSIRECVEKRCFGFAATGYWREMQVSEEHPMIVLDGKKYRHKLKLAANASYRRKKGIPEGGDKKPIEYKGSLICRKEAQDVDLKDYLLAPLPTCGKINLEKDTAWMLGQLLADGTIINNEIRVTLNKNERHLKEIERIFANYRNNEEARSFAHGDGNGWRVVCCKKTINLLFASYITGKLTKKKLTQKAFELDKESRMHLLGGYFDGDGSFSKTQHKLIANNYSKDMADQLYFMLLSCGINCSLNRVPLYGDHYPTDAEWCYRIIVPSSEVSKITPYMRSAKIPADFVPKKMRELRFFYEDTDGTVFLAQPLEYKKEFLYTGEGYDIQVDPEHAFVANGYVGSNCRFYYENEPKVAAGIDFYSAFPINGMKLECKKKSVLRYYERLVDKIDLMYWLRMISHQRFLLGDVFVMTEISCPHCDGSGIDKDTHEVCNHADGTISKITILNPDWIEVMKTPISQEPQIVLLPDEEIQRVIATKQPKFLYDQIPENIRAQVLGKKPILLSNRVTSHLKHGGVPYGTYGESLIRRLFTILAYKTKLMTANWIVAERLILPVRVVKIGSDERPADDEAISDASAQLAAVANDPNLTIVTHNHFDYEWYGASGKIHQITAEMEAIGKEILDGLMLNQTLLNGEMAGYSSAQVGVETMIRRIESWRNELAQWIEKHIFLPVAKMQGFVDEKESEEFGETVYMYPRVKWNDLRLRDNTNQLQQMVQLQQSGLISAQTLLEQFDLDYDIEIERIRSEQINAMQSGQLAGGMGGGGGVGGLGGLGGLGGGGGGAMPMDMGGGGGAPGGMGGDMGGGAGGAPGGMPGAEMGMGAPPAGGGMPAAAESSGKIYRRGKAPKVEEKEFAPPKMATIQLTKPESKMYRTLVAMKLPYRLFAQYKQPVPSKSNFYLMDFAIPDLGIDLECDGAKWHTAVEDKQRDKERDYMLASMGWRVIRFTEEALNEHIDKVATVIHREVANAAKEKKAMKKKAQNESTANYKVVEFSPFVGCQIYMGKLNNEVKTG